MDFQVVMAEWVPNIEIITVEYGSARSRVS